MAKNKVNAFGEKMLAPLFKIKQVKEHETAVREAFGPIETKTGIKLEGFLFIILSIIFGVFLWTNWCLLSNVTLTAYFIYSSLMAIRTSKDTSSYLFFWVVTCGYAVVEETPVGLILDTIPLYWLLKPASLFALGLPEMGISRKAFQLLTGRDIDAVINNSSSKKEVNVPPSGKKLSVKVVSGSCKESSDTFVHLQVLPVGGRESELSEGLKYKTKTILGSDKPVFSEQIKISPLPAFDSKLLVTLMHQSELGSNKSLGESTLALNEYPTNEVQSVRVNLTKDDADCGHLDLELTLCDFM
eukprot:CAMPEP_0185776722 /NCGR_PEP_ID=MMETSP1174-20130828/86768_1 /TAXON_ID=35687 /ORGANISM="Dictyocha speculum, Strain CCMP1381" /LENGTH=299 /DNA_ID=CAMNT_0028464799 /DNA_START=24 /DNA_END=923 /DNA_ORIENTATION=+